MRKPNILRNHARLGLSCCTLNRNLFIICIFVVSFVIFLTMIVNYDGFYTDREERIARRMNELSESINYLRHLEKEKQKAFLQLQNRYKYLLNLFPVNRLKSSAAYLYSNGSSIMDKDDMKNEGGELIVDNSSRREKLEKLKTLKYFMNNSSSGKLFAAMTSSSADDGSLSLPSIYDHMPHLLQYPDALTPAFRLAAAADARQRQPPAAASDVFSAANGGRRSSTAAWLTIGVPTVKRNKTSYLPTTLRSLIDNLTPDARSQTLIVVFIGELGLTKFATDAATSLHIEFKSVIEEGLLEIIVPNSNFYPDDLESIEPTHGDSSDRMRWRTKQNLDYAYLMMYCQNRGTFYMQLEDDVITKPNYLETIKDFMSNQDSKKWYMLEFSTLGFIGKLFRSSDLPQVIDFILMFHRLKPVDWLLHLMFMVRYCHLEKFGKECQQIVNERRIRCKPSLFQHVGVHSSLNGKVQKLKEKDFGKQPLHKAHADNPPAVVSTSLKIYQKFTLESAYQGETYFWGLLPQPGDWVKFNFSPPISLEGFTIRSGNAEHPDDMFFNTTLEVLLVVSSGGRTTDGPAVNYPVTDDGFLVLGWFSSTGLVQAENLTLAAPVKALRLVVHAESANWAILSEIWIRPCT